MVAQTLHAHPSITDTDISYELADFTFAGTNMPSLTLTYLLWRLANDATLQEAIHHELLLCSRNPFGGVPVNYANMPDSSLFMRTIHEVLRCYPPAPNGFSREPPPGGANVGDVFIPDGVRTTLPNQTLETAS